MKIIPPGVHQQDMGSGGLIGGLAKPAERCHLGEDMK